MHSLGGLATRRRCLLRSCAAVITLLFLPPAYSQDDPSPRLGPGDQGFDHKYLHKYYQEFFHGDCPCSVGECRPTLVRPNASVPDTAMEVLIDHVWYPVPKDALKLRNDIPPELLPFAAHVCARRFYRNGELKPVIECVVYNGAT
jgi:hypothetical protein